MWEDNVGAKILIAYECSDQGSIILEIGFRKLWLVEKMLDDNLYITKGIRRVEDGSLHCA